MSGNIFEIIGGKTGMPADERGRRAMDGIFGGRLPLYVT